MACMGGRIHDDFIPGPTVNTKSDLVAHRPRRKIHGIFFSEKVAYHFNQAIDRWVFLLLLVPDFSLAHEFPHAGCWPGNGITEQINQNSIHCSLLTPEFFRILIHVFLPLMDSISTLMMSAFSKPFSL